VAFCSDQQKSVNPGEAPTVIPLKVEKEYCSFEDALKHDFGSGKKKLRKKLWKKREVLWGVLSEQTKPCFFVHRSFSAARRTDEE